MLVAMSGDAKKKTAVNTTETERITVLAVLIAVLTEANSFLIRKSGRKRTSEALIPTEQRDVSRSSKIFPTL